MAQQTRHGNYGGARQLYGSFSGKTESATTKARTTRHGLYGGARSLYGSFAGKTASVGGQLLPSIVMNHMRRLRS